MIDKRLLAGAGLVGSALTALLAAVGQVDPDPQLSHVSLTVSDFAVHDRGGATDMAMVVFGLSAWCLLPVLRQAAPRILLAVFGAAMVVAALAPTDLGPLTATGYLHRYASMLAFVMLPLAAVTLRPVGRALRATAAVAGGFAVLMLASATLADRYLIGAAERYLLLSEVVLLGLLAWRGWRDCPARPARSTVSHA
ncbi:DUF998 domain-containing protein [Catellatospora methionotrophica]|uniref:DUF998 domain-containing protein n=1 Tax=Catellatospora methionotrophica TaxID=121620 RepID=UPI003403DA38